MLRFLAAPAAPRTWLATAHMVTGIPVALAAAAAVAGFGLATASLTLTVAGAPLALVGLFLVSRGFARVQRSRFAAFLDLEIPPPPPRPAGLGPLRSLAAEAREPRTWRQAAFHLLSAVTEGAGGCAVAFGWAAGLVLTSAYAWRYVPGTPPRPGNPKELADLTAGGVALLFTVPWLARGLAGLDGALARDLLGPTHAEDLTRRVETLAQSRAAVLDAADAERRRIERDLHDGAQQRLVALAMNLGVLRALHPDLPPDAAEAVAACHDEAKAALAELRDLVRGLHPAVLDDRGLDAALSGVAARSPVPVTLTVDLPGRPPPHVEAVAYFVVSESLANVAKHSRAARAEVTVRRRDGRIVVVISDDGTGGATDGGAGSGLRGLRRRAASVDGTLLIDSPPGGPTSITVELPCAS